MEIKIRNKKSYKGQGEYIGRPSVLGNPFKITEDTHHARGVAVVNYCKWLRREIEKGSPKIIEALEHLFSILYETQELNLICWCSPKHCHGEVIKQVLMNKYHYGDWLVHGEIGVWS